MGLVGITALVCAIDLAPSGALPVDDLKVYDEEGSTELTAIEVVVPAGEDDATVPIQIGWTPAAGDEAQALTGITLTTFVPGATATVLPEPSADGLSLARNDKRPLLIQISDVTESAPAGGYLLAEVGGAVKRLATISVTTTPGPDAIEYVGATDDALAAIAHTRRARVPVRLRNPTTQELEVTLQVDDLLSATGRVTSAGLSDTAPSNDDTGDDAADEPPPTTVEVTIEAGATERVWIEADLTEIGAHVTTLTARLGRVSGTPLVVTVDRQPTTLEATMAFDPADAYGELRFVMGTPAASAGASFGVENTGDTPTELAFDVGSVGLKQGTKVSNVTGVTVTIDCDGGGAEEEEDDDRCVVQPGSEVTPEATFEGLERPGEYTITLTGTEVGGEGRTEATVTVHVRRAIYWAILFLGLGVAVSGVLNFYVSRRRLAAKQQAALSLATEVVAQLPWPLGDPYTDAVAQAIESRRSALQSKIDSVTPPTDLDAQIEGFARLAALVPVWLRYAVRQGTEPASRGPELDHLRVVFITSDGVTVDEQDAHKLELAKALQRIGTAEAWQPIDDAIAAWAVAVGDVPPTDDDPTKIGAAVDAAAAARGALRQAGDPVAIAEKVATAVDEWRGSMGLTLRDAMAAGELPVDRASWDAATSEALALQVRLRSDPDESPMELWEEVSAAWVRLIEIRLAAAKAVVGTRPEPSEEERAAASKLEEVEALLPGQPGRADKTVRDAARALFLPPAAAAAGMPPADPEIKASTFAAPKLQPASVWKGPSWEKAAQRYRRWEWVVIVVAALVAVVLGLVANYQNAPGWGTWADCAGAFLWGLGVGAGTQYAGLVTFRSQTFGTV
ncbi:MAG TPA: hypothetical protein VF228_03390 [Iamia sp.]